MNSYPEYKECDISWLGEVPKHWEIVRIKSKFNLVKNPSFNPSPVVLSLTQNGIKIRDISNNEGQMPQTYEGYNTVEKGNICLNPMDLEVGAAATSKFDGVISNAYFTIAPKDEKEINNAFYGYYFNMHYKRKIFYPFGKGVGRPEGCGGRWTLGRETLLKFPIAILPKIEQDQIVRYLDYKLAKIAKFIKAKKKLISALKEEKQAVINQAVTKGINPRIKMKPSGIEWLGDVPENWEVRRLKSIVRNTAINTNEKECNEIYVGMENVESWTGNIVNASTETIFDSQVKRFISDNILFGKLRPYLAKVVKTTQNGVCSGEFLVLVSRGNNNDIDFLTFLLRSHKVIDIITSSTYGAKMPRAEWSFIGNLKLAFPTLNEQQIIVNYINTKIYSIDKTIERIKQEIALITEYRTRLISDVVTGKVDVRDIVIDDIIEEIIEPEEDSENVSEMEEIEIVDEV